MSRNGTSKTTVIKHSDATREKNKRDKKNQEKGMKMLAKLKEDPSSNPEGCEALEAGLKKSYPAEDSDDEMHQLW